MALAPCRRPGRLRRWPAGNAHRDVLDVTGNLVTFGERCAFTNRDDALIPRSTLRFPDRDQIKALATMAGLAVEAVHGGWSREPFDADRPKIIVRLVKSRRRQVGEGRGAGAPERHTEIIPK